MPESRYEQLIHRDLIEKSKIPEIVCPTLAYDGIRDGEDLSFTWNCITDPFTIVEKPCENDYDEFWAFTGSNLMNLDDFQAEVELTLGETAIFHHRKKPIIFLFFGLYKSVYS